MTHARQRRCDGALLAECRRSRGEEKEEEEEAYVSAWCLINLAKTSAFAFAFAFASFDSRTKGKLARQSKARDYYYYCITIITWSNLMEMKEFTGN